MSRRYLTWLVVLVALPLLALVFTLAEEDPVWIKVNDTPITKAMVEREVFVFRRVLAQEFSEAELIRMAPQIKREAMLLLVQLQVLNQLADAERITVKDSLVDQVYAEVKLQYPSEAAFREELTRLRMTEAEMKLGIRELIRYRVLMDLNTTVTEPTEAEVAALYDRIKGKIVRPAKAGVMLIFIALPENAGGLERRQRKALADNLRMQLRAGADFADLARRYSDARSRPDGGREILVRGRQTKALDDAIFGLQPRQLSEVIETPEGFYIVRLIDLTPERTPSLEEVRPKLERALKGAQRRKQFQIYIDEQVKKAKVEYLEPLPMPEPEPQDIDTMGYSIAV